MNGIITSKRTSSTYRPELALAPGPQIIAEPGAGTVDELYGAAWALALYRTGPQLLQAQGGVWVPIPEHDAVSALRNVRHVALAFDQAARPVVAFERAGQVFVRQWSPALAQYVTRGPWPGHDPVLLADAVVLGSVPGSDVVLFYLDAQRANVLHRIQHEFYGTAHDVASVPAGAVLDQVVGLPHRWLLYGEANRQPLVLGSDLYPVTLHDGATGAVSGLLGGAWYSPVVTLTGHDGATGAVSGLLGGAWFSPMIASNQQTNLSGTVSGLLGGSYAVVVVPLTLPTTKTSGTVSGLNGGTWT